METQAFEHSWQWYWLAVYISALGGPVAIFYLVRGWRVRRQQAVRPRVSWQYAMSCVVILGAVMGALKNSNDELALATEQRQQNYQALKKAGYRYATTLDEAMVSDQQSRVCDEALVADWDFHIGKRDEALRYHVFCLDGEEAMDLAASDAFPGQSSDG